MALTKAELKQIEEIINRRFLGFTYEALGDVPLTEDELKKLRASGLLKDNVRSFVGDPVALGKIAALVPKSSIKDLDYNSVLRMAKNMAPTTEVEKRSIEYARAHAGEYIKGIKDMMLRDVKAVTSRGSDAALRAVQDGVASAIAKRETKSELKTVLFNRIDNSVRDWHRVAHTEINTAVQNGIYKEIRAKSADGADQLVFKRPAPDACRHCKRVYLQSDGITPKIFRLKDLEDTNVGLKANDWGPVIGSVHPHCNCQLSVVPDGYDFTKKKVAVESFNHGGETYGVGKIVDDSTYLKLSKENKGRIGVDAILSYTGETASVSTKKSMAFSDIDECLCDHD